MKNVLLIVLPYLRIRETISSRLISIIALPFGALSIATYCKDTANIKLIDCNADPDYKETIAREMVEFKPEIVGFSVLYENAYPHLHGILDTIMGINPDVITVIGGTGTFPIYNEILSDEPQIDAVCYHDGEVPFKKLCESDDPIAYLNEDPAWVTHESLTNGIVPKKTTVPRVDDIIDLDYSFVDLEKYSSWAEFSPTADTGVVKKRFHVFTSFNCPFSCSFCFKTVEDDNRMRFASVDKVISRVKYLVDNYGMDVFTISDDQFVFNMKRAKEILRRLAPFNLQVEIMQGGSVDFIDEEMIILMKKAGMKRISLPIESGSKEILDKIINKPLDLDKAKETIKLLHDNDIWVHSFFVLGSPGETDAHRAETVKWIRDAEIDWCSINALSPIRGTPVYKLCVENGYIDGNTKLGELNYGAYIIDTPGYPAPYVADQIYKINLQVNFVDNRQMRMGEFDAAAKVFRQILGNIFEEQAFAHYYLSKCYTEMECNNLARLHMDKFKTIIDKDAKWAEYAKHFGIGG